MRYELCSICNVAPGIHSFGTVELPIGEVAYEQVHVFCMPLVMDGMAVVEAVGPVQYESFHYVECDDCYSRGD